MDEVGRFDDGFSDHLERVGALDTTDDHLPSLGGSMLAS
jgi:hypothetical protein